MYLYYSSVSYSYDLINIIIMIINIIINNCIIIILFMHSLNVKDKMTLFSLGNEELM